MLYQHKKVIFFLIYAFLSFFIISCKSSNDRKITITGKVRMVGAEPFSHIVVTTEEGRDYIIPDNLTHDYSSLINQTITVSAIVEIRKLVSVSGKYKIIEYHMKNPQILK